MGDVKASIKNEAALAKQSDHKTSARDEDGGLFSSTHWSPQEPLLAGLDPDQVSAVVETRGPIICIAPAGSGKTAVLTRRIAYRINNGETDPKRVLSVTFTNKAAAELVHRISALGLRDPILAGTFHGLALRQVTEYNVRLNRSTPKLLDNRAGYLRQIISGQTARDLGLAAVEINWMKTQMVSPETYPDLAESHGRKPPLPAKAIADIAVQYERCKRRDRLMDFDDILYMAISHLREDDSFRSAVNWRHRHFYVDEFQDINPLQYELLELWRDERDDLFAVGDPNQAIYSWNGANPEIMASFASTRSGATIIELGTNYRCSTQIVKLANRLATDSDTKGATDGPQPRFLEFSSEHDELENIAHDTQRSLARGDKLEDCAVLTRTQQLADTIANHLQQQEIPVTSGTHRHSWLRSRLAHTSLKSFEQLRSELTQQMRYQDCADSMTLIAKYETETADPSVRGFTLWARRYGVAPAGGVTVTTFHSAKGLGWKNVHIAGCESGYVPIIHAHTKEQKAEERRLLYVAVTRCAENLTLSWAQRRTIGDKVLERNMSPWFEELQSFNQHQAIPKVSVSKQIASLREKLASPGSDDYRTNLIKWRDKTARAAAIPQKVVLSDEQLDELALKRPQSQSDLNKITSLRASQRRKFGAHLTAK